MSFWRNNSKWDGSWPSTCNKIEKKGRGLAKVKTHPGTGVKYITILTGIILCTALVAFCIFQISLGYLVKKITRFKSMISKKIIKSRRQF